MKSFLALLTLGFLLGCAAREDFWSWVPAGGNGGQDLRQAIAECEEYALIANSNGNIEGLRRARPYGGWGDFAFEFCMHKKGWELERRPGS